jgi:hypothetical protein
LLAAPIAGLTLGVGLDFFPGTERHKCWQYHRQCCFLMVVLSVNPLYRFAAEKLGLIIIKVK